MEGSLVNPMRVEQTIKIFSTHKSLLAHNLEMVHN